PVMSLIVERVIFRLNARLISVAVNPDCRRVMIMARCRLLIFALWCACPYNLPSRPSARIRRPTLWALRLGNWAAMIPADTLPASSRITLSSLSVQRLTATSIPLMRQRLQRLDPIQQLLLLHGRFSPVLLQRLFCCCQLGGARADQVGLVVLDRCRRLADQNKPAATNQLYSRVHHLAGIGVPVNENLDVILDGISDSCHDDLGFSLLTFSPSKEGLSLLLRWAPRFGVGVRWCRRRRRTRPRPCACPAQSEPHPVPGPRRRESPRRAGGPYPSGWRCPGFRSCF